MKIINQHFNDFCNQFFFIQIFEFEIYYEIYRFSTHRRNQIIRKFC